MDKRNMIRRKTLIIPVIIVLSLFFVYLVSSLLFFQDDPFFSLLGRCTDTWLLFHDGMANRLLERAGPGVAVNNHQVIASGAEFDQIRTGTLMRKLIALLLVLAWLFPSSLRSKLLFSVAVILLNFLMTPFTIALQAYLSAQGTDLYSHTRISRTPAHILNMTLLFGWLRKHRETCWNPIC